VGFVYTESGQEHRFTVGRLSGDTANISFQEPLDENDLIQEIWKEEPNPEQALEVCHL
jgi:hypothetical protein